MTDDGSGGKGWTEPVNNVVAALRDSPLLLVLVLLNAAMFTMLTYLILKSAEYRFKERDQMMQTLNTCIDKLEDRNKLEWKGQAQKMSPLP